LTDTFRTNTVNTKVNLWQNSKNREQTGKIYSVQWENSHAHTMAACVWEKIHWRILLLGFQTFLSGWRVLQPQNHLF